MKTEIIDVSSDFIQYDTIQYIAETIRRGGTVAFPTETVYGIGANALDQKAVEKIFVAKGRPSDNPLIVHIADKIQVETLAQNIPDIATKCMEQYWPGPLTVVLKKKEYIPAIVTAGLDTIAIRIPQHPIALAILKAAGVPVAAPSANRSGSPSATIAEHVVEDLDGRVDIIVRGEEARVGLESTVLDVTCNPPMILRPGGILQDHLKQICGEVVVSPSVLRELQPNEIPKAPGMKYTHYSPKAQVIVICGTPEKQVIKICELQKHFEKLDKKVGVLATKETHQYYGPNTMIMGSVFCAEEIAANLFALLRKFDQIGVDIILAESISEEGIGFAVMNRLLKAAGYTIENV